MKNSFNDPKSIVLFDGVCNLCNAFVAFLIPKDPQGKLLFASLQSDAGQTLLKQFGLPQNEFVSFAFVEGEKFYLRSSAALRVLKNLGGFWRIFYILILIPVPLRDFVYSQIAKRRYALFGRQESCMLPAPDIKSRFLD